MSPDRSHAKVISNPNQLSRGVPVSVQATAVHQCRQAIGSAAACNANRRSLDSTAEHSVDRSSPGTAAERLCVSAL
jgi:hypothetical protein